MTGDRVVAVDLGATSGRVIVGQVGPATLETRVISRFANRPVRAADGLHWDLFGLYGEAFDGLRRAFAVMPDIRSVGVDSWGVDYGLFRGAGTSQARLIGAPFHYRDDRTARGVARVHQRVAPPELFARNGLQLLPINTVYQVAAEADESLELADALLFIPDVVGFWLTGVSRSERTIASTSGLLDPSSRTWDEGLLEMLELPRALMQPLISPGERLGVLSPTVAQSLGAPDGVSVTAVGSHDTASAVLAVPMQPEAAAYISCGTWGLVGVELERPVLTLAALTESFTNEGGVDGRVRFLRNIMGLWLLSEALRTWDGVGDSIDLPTLLGGAAEVTVDVPVFDVHDARFLPPGDMPARIDVWCDEHGVPAPRTRAEYVRSIIESLAQAFADAAHAAGRIGGVDVHTIHMVGGGALNELLCQRIADRAGLPVVAGPVEATSLGNILVQARAVGLVSGSTESLRDLVTRTHTPRRYEPLPPQRRERLR
jgi:rhamnulokinase